MVNRSLALLRGEGEFLSMISAAVNVVSIGCTRQPFALLSPFSKLARYFQEARPDVVLSFGHTINCLAAWAKLLRRFPFRLIVSERSSFGTRMAEDARLQRWRRVARARFLYGQAELCVCVSRGVADELVELGVMPRGKIRVIYNPIVGPGLTEQMMAPVSHPWLSYAMPPVILSAGRLMDLKGLDTLIRAFARLRRGMQIDARLIIAGEGPERRNLEALAAEMDVAEDVCFTGYTPNPYAYMAKAAVVTLSSHYEGFGNVLAEALACGANVVSTDCRSGPREILEDGKWGRLVPVGDADAFSAALRDTLAAPLPAEALKTRAAHFSVERSVEAYCGAIFGSGSPPQTEGAS